MREILFRGQTRKYGEKVRMGDGQKLTGHWVYGGVLQGVGSHSIIYGGENVNDPGENLDKWCVHTDTLGQFTGKTVKNGKAFDGDILKSIDGIFLVCWDEEKSAFVMRFLEYPYETLYLEEMYDDAEIIGNIHDNPELLKNPKFPLDFWDGVWYNTYVKGCC